ncbi:hypothetical protein ACP4OV_027696 [Aristida adscensionis]
MDKTSSAAGVARWLHATVIVTFTFAAVLAPAAAAVQRLPHLRASLKPGAGGAGDDAVAKDCITTDQDGRNWPCWRRRKAAPRPTRFACPIENRLGAQMFLECDDDPTVFYVNAGEALNQSYLSAADRRALRPYLWTERTGPTVTCDWGCAGNEMAGLVVWDERWPEAPSCREDGGGGRCRLVFESNREVVLVTRAGRRVLGDVAVKECSRNLWGTADGCRLASGAPTPSTIAPTTAGSRANV